MYISVIHHAISIAKHNLEHKCNLKHYMELNELVDTAFKCIGEAKELEIEGKMYI